MNKKETDDGWTHLTDGEDELKKKETNKLPINLKKMPDAPNNWKLNMIAA